MRHLKTHKLFESDAFYQDPDIQDIKDIILELKDEFPYLEGVIVNQKYDDDEIHTIIKLKPLPIYNEYVTILENIEKRIHYANCILMCSKRLQNALNRSIRIQNLFSENGDTINIVIDDIKNQGKIR
jgi:hypothetical protein